MLLATYGTLRKGYRNHHFLAKEPFVKTDYVCCYGIIYDGLEDYPGGCFVGDKHDKHIFLYVEIYDVCENVLAAIDELEGHPFLYKRISIQTLSNVPVYIYNQDRARGLFDYFILVAEGENKYRRKPHT